MRTSTSPASNACTAVVPSEIIRPLTRSSVTLSASRHSAHLIRSMLELCCHCSSWNGPFVTMFAASVHFSPYCSTALRLHGQERVVGRLLHEPRLRRGQRHLERPVVHVDADLVGERLAVVLRRIQLL